MCQCLYYLLCMQTPNSDVPDAPQGVEVIETRDNRGSCVFTSQLNPPSNSGPDDILHYIIEYQSRRDMIASTSFTLIVPDCTPELRINVTAVNRCGSIGKSVTNIVPIFLPESEGASEDPNGNNVGKCFLLP